MQTTESQSLHMGHRVSVKSRNPYWIGDLSHEGGDLYSNFSDAVDAIHLSISAVANPDGLTEGWEDREEDFIEALPLPLQDYLHCLGLVRFYLNWLNCELDGCPNIVHPHSRRVELILEKTRSIYRMLANSLMNMEELDSRRLFYLFDLAIAYRPEPEDIDAIDREEKAKLDQEFLDLISDDLHF
nr:MAG TPA: hypothetical protein [Caudoviricetes sp.]